MKRLLLVVGVLLVLGTSAPAFAQGRPSDPGRPEDPGYPGTTARDRQPTRENQRATLASGESRTIESCGFQPGSSATVSFNGEAAGGDTAGSDGCVTTDVLGAGFERSRNGGCGTIRVNGVEFEVRSGTNQLVVDGTGSNGAARSVLTQLDIECARAAGVAADGTGLPRTGVAVLRWVAVALALLAVGTSAVLFERRRLARRVA